MNQALLERLRGFQIPSATPIPAGQYMVAHLQGLDFDGILNSPDFGFKQPFDVDFGKMMVRTTSHLLGGDACGRFGYTELTEMSVLLDYRGVGARWKDAVDLQSYLVAQAASKMSLQLEDEALFTCRLYSFSKSDLVIAFFLWRRQEAALAALDRYCSHVLVKGGSASENVRSILDGLAPVDKEEILRQNSVEYGELPAWQRVGSGVSLADNGSRVVVDANLPDESSYSAYLQRYLD
jgi:tRNA(His) guanylyltransferase